MTFWEQLIEFLDSFGAIAQLLGLVLVILRALGLTV